MDFAESLKAVSERIINLALAHGCDVASFRNELGMFEHRNRWIEFWNIGQELRYHLSGEIKTLPTEFAASEASFGGVWDETGSISDLGQALDLLRSWLVDCKEVEELPRRAVFRRMI